MSEEPKLSSAAARARLETLAPEFADLMGEVTEFLRDLMLDDTISDKDKLKVVKEIRQTGAEVFDRGGVPAVRASLVDARVTNYKDKSTSELLALIGRKMASLTKGDLQFMGQSNPMIAGLLEGTEPVDAEVVKPKKAKPGRRRRNTTRRSRHGEA